MKDTFTKSISTLLQPNHRDLQTVLSKVKAIANLNQLVTPLLEPTLRPHCQVANLSSGILVMLAANSSVATQLRYQTPDYSFFVLVPREQSLPELERDLTPEMLL